MVTKIYRQQTVDSIKKEDVDRALASMIDKVACAIWSADPNAGKGWQYVGYQRREGYFAQARAAIEALREPTEAMHKAGGESEPFQAPGNGPNGLWHPGRIIAATAWRAMIDAVLQSHIHK